MSIKSLFVIVGRRSLFRIQASIGCIIATPIADYRTNGAEFDCALSIESQGKYWAKKASAKQWANGSYFLILMNTGIMSGGGIRCSHMILGRLPHVEPTIFLASIFCN
jgi:hypothetical protein